MVVGLQGDLMATRKTYNDKSWVLFSELLVLEAPPETWVDKRINITKGVMLKLGQYLQKLYMHLAHFQCKHSISTCAEEIVNGHFVQTM